MPANLTPDYFKAEQWYRSATTNQEKILAVEQMLAVMPKHKGTEHIKADLRRKLSQLREAGAQKTRAGGVDIFHVPRTGAGQIVLLGTPNCGKSSILARLTHAKVHVADFPYATSAPVPGMVTFEDVQIQLVDMPPITAEFVMPGQVGTYRNSDLIAVVIDLSGDVVEQMRVCMDFLQVRNLLADSRTSMTDGRGNVPGKRAICICTKSDIAGPGALEKLRKSCEYPLEYIEISPLSGQGMDLLPAKLFEVLNVIRVYAKPPGKKPDMNEPFTVPAGATVMDLATLIHRHLAEQLKFARIWGTGVYDGQNAPRNHILHDKDIIELHFG